MSSLYNTSVELDTRLARLLSLGSTATLFRHPLPSIPHFFLEDSNSNERTNSLGLNSRTRSLHSQYLQSPLNLSILPGYHPHLGYQLQQLCNSPNSELNSLGTLSELNSTELSGYSLGPDLIENSALVLLWAAVS
jgi:hypothetical protein